MEEARGRECSGEFCGWEQVTRGGVKQLAEGEDTNVHKGLEEVKKVAVRSVGSAATLAGALASACISCGNADTRGKSGLKGGEAVWAGGTRVGRGEARPLSWRPRLCRRPRRQSHGLLGQWDRLAT